jgi:predicted AlkP superfamily pyrophosphatase or phosphodiesterase
VHPTAVLNVVGLTRSLVSRLPSLASLVNNGLATVGHVTPAVTCSVQATYLTGTRPSEHGIVSNGWFDRAESEIKFWKQSDKLVQRPRIWDIARNRDTAFTCANLFWWYAMYSSADVTVTPRPMYPADGRKLPDVWTNPPDLRQQLQYELGQFPLFKFWGPMASIDSTRWIAEASIRVEQKFDPTLLLIYLPHLDYCLQQRGPDAAGIHRELVELDAVLARLLSHLRQRGRRIVVLSEYGIEAVDTPIHLNRQLRVNGLITVREELERELLDAGASKAFAVADHQVAHVYVNDPRKIDEAEAIVRSVPGVERVLRGETRKEAGLDHPRAGDLIAIAQKGAWFTYYYWQDDSVAPDFARTVDIHRKPGYDPAELFLDPQKALLKPRIAWKLFKRKLGLRALLDVIPLDATLVKGSHGREPSSADAAPVYLSSEPARASNAWIKPTDVCGLILDHVFD